MPEKYEAHIEKKRKYIENTSDLTACMSQARRPPSLKLVVLQGT